MLLGLDGFGWPAHDLEVVGEVAHEGDIDGGCGDAVVEGGYGHAAGTSLAATFDEDVAGVCLRQGAEVVDASDAVEIGSAIVISVGTLETILNPVSIAVVGLVLPLSAHADDGLDIFLSFNVEIPDVAAVSQEEHMKGKPCILVAGDGYGVEDLDRIVVDAEHLGRIYLLARRTLFLYLLDLWLEGHGSKFGARLVPKRLEVGLCVGQRYDILWFKADGVERFMPLSSPLLVSIVDDVLSSGFDKDMVEAGCGDARIDAKTGTVTFRNVDTLRNHTYRQPRIGDDTHGDVGVQRIQQ